MRQFTIIILIILFSFPTITYCEEQSETWVSLREYIEKILNERDKALAIGQSSLDSKFVRIESWLKDIGEYNGKINKLNDKISDLSVVFSEKFNRVDNRITALETENKY